jgi:ubiquinone/menaquinone biosynthesis C-methylase UbiE
VKEQPSELEASYDRVAEQYADEFFRELERKPFDRELLEAFAESVRARGEVCEIGCGPGHISRYLHDRGATMRGIDLSGKMIKWARHLNPDISFAQGNMLALNLPDATLAAIVSFYAIIHIERDKVTRALREMNRVLKPGGLLLLSFHGGEGELHRDEWYDKPISIDVTLFGNDEMSGYLDSAGFEAVSFAEREPYEFEYPTRRVYVSAKKPTQIQ